jgi:drug/metabolite transporter (DMT)-like permease
LDVLAGLICGPILILWTLLSGELNMAINFESLHVLGFQVCTGLLVLVSESTHRYPTHRRSIIVEFHSQVDFFTWLNPLFELFFSLWLTEVDCALRREVGVVPVQVVTALSCIIAFCLNYTIFLNTTLNSALTQTMCGNLKDLGTVFFGWICFGGLPFDWLNVFGQFLGFLGSGMYAYCKLKGK